MNSKNIFVAIGVIGAGVVLYKLLLGFVLPAVIFVSLRYALKFLLKGSVSDSEQEESQVLSKSPISTLKNNVVEIKPIKAEVPI